MLVVCCWFVVSVGFAGILVFRILPCDCLYFECLMVVCFCDCNYYFGYYSVGVVLLDGGWVWFRVRDFRCVVLGVDCIVLMICACLVLFYLNS